MGEAVVFLRQGYRLWDTPDKQDAVWTFCQAEQLCSGTGLGLSICQMLVEHMGGETAYSQKPVKGRHFGLLLPLLLRQKNFRRRKD